MAAPSTPKKKVEFGQQIQSKDVPPPKPRDYTSHGVKDNDVFLLPGSDFQVMLALTVLGAAVRIFRIYQPDSVVFDEVQYVHSSTPARAAHVGCTS